MILRSTCVVAAGLALGMATMGCDNSWQSPLPTQHIRLAPTTQPISAEVHLDRSLIMPVHRELLAIDLSAVAQLVQARNTDILSARRRVEAVYGQYASRVGGAFPVLSPGVLFEFHRGGARDSSGRIITADFASLQPAAALDWVVNPGQVVYDILASKKQLQASQQDELMVRIRTMQQAATQYYDLCLAQATIAADREIQRQAEELVRITSSKLKEGTAVPADDLRARAVLAQRQQDMLLAINGFYHASISLAATLDLDASVTLAPRPDKVVCLTLVDDNAGLDRLMVLAIENRPDLKATRERLAAADAGQNATVWGGLGPGVAAGHEGGGIASRTNGQSFDMRGQQDATVGVGWRLSAAAFGDIQTAQSRYRLAIVDVQAQIDQLRAEVVQAVQDSRTNVKLVPIATQELTAAAESLRRITVSFRVGKAILLDVLEAQSLLAEARLRYARSVVAYNQSQIRILAAMGLLDAAALGDKSGVPTATSSSLSTTDK